MLDRIAEYAVQAASMAPLMVPVGPYRAALDPDSNSPHTNYAIPVWAMGTPEETAEHFARLRSLFAEHQRHLRWEFVDTIWPGLPSALDAAGFVCTGQLPLLTCHQSLPPPSHPVLWLDPGDAAALEAYARIQQEAFDTDIDLHHLRYQIVNGFWRCALSLVDGQPAGAACLIPIGATSELAGMATRPAFRRRGVATALTRFLTNAFLLDGGELVWLAASTELARRAYEHSGFSRAGVRWHYIDPA